MASFKGGYDYEFVDFPSKSLECSICLLTLRDPHVVSCCGNHFCHICISRILRDNKPCPLCNEPGFTTFLHKGVAREVNALKVYCPQKQLGCDWEGELGQVAQHLNPGVEARERGCGFVMVECVNKCGEWFQRRTIRKHETEDCPRRPVEVQMAFVVSRLNALAADNKATNDKIQVLQEENRAFKEKVQELKAENASLKQQLETHSPPAPVPPFYFTLNNYEQYRRNNYCRLSPPFYSHSGGYKMKLQIYPNGTDSGEGSHLSVSIALSRGEYDDKLKWPFRGEVNVEMYNFTLKIWTHIKCIEFDESTTHSSSKRPVECLGNAGLGFPTCMPHSQLTKDYLRYDIIRFRVASVQVR